MRDGEGNIGQARRSKGHTICCAWSGPPLFFFFPGCKHGERIDAQENGGEATTLFMHKLSQLLYRFFIYSRLWCSLGTLATLCYERITDSWWCCVQAREEAQPSQCGWI